MFAVLTVELGCVFMMFGPRLLRRSSALYIAALQVGEYAVNEMECSHEKLGLLHFDRQFWSLSLDYGSIVHPSVRR